MICPFIIRNGSLENNVEISYRKSLKRLKELIDQINFGTKKHIIKSC